MHDSEHVLKSLQTLPPRLRADLARHLRCIHEARAEERERLRPDPRLADWLDLLDELEASGPLMREVVRDSLEAIPTPPAGRRG